MEAGTVWGIAAAAANRSGLFLARPLGLDLGLALAVGDRGLLRWVLGQRTMSGMCVCLVRRSLAIRAASRGEMPIGLLDRWSAAMVWYESTAMLQKMALAMVWVLGGCSSFG